ncbi:MAG: hypothetical protein KatS3mg077_2996 [Candidatus Binatia bacterium]|nr:MAG: hypothetical protein KatS3mg077_2996 [Candidatus Binatia bacterium]
MRQRGWIILALICFAPMARGVEKPLEAEQTPQASPAPPKPAVPPTLSAEDLDLLKKILFTIEAEPDSGEAPLKVKFTVDLLGEELKKPRFHWDFGDGTTSKERSPTHTYKKPGEYKASCRIDDVDDRWGRDELTIFVDPKE